MVCIMSGNSSSSLFCQNTYKAFSQVEDIENSVESCVSAYSCVFNVDSSTPVRARC